MSQAAQLIRFERSGREPIQGILVGIHDDGADAEELLEWCTAVAPNWNVCVPRAPRSRNPLRTGGKTLMAPAAVQQYRGFCWTRQDPDGRTDPASLGDALVELAELLTEMKRREPSRPIILIGEGVGGTLASQLASRSPNLLSDAISIRPAPFRIEGFEQASTPIASVSEVMGRDAAVRLGKLRLRRTRR